MADVRITGHLDPVRNRVSIIFTVNVPALDENLNELLGRIEAATKEFAEEHTLTVEAAK